MMPEKAIVIGGSIAGLLAARVLSDHFEEVVLLEKDNFTDDGKARNGAPQANHVHILLVKGKEILQEFFPELEMNLIKRGTAKIEPPPPTIPKTKPTMIPDKMDSITVDDSIWDNKKYKAGAASKTHFSCFPVILHLLGPISNEFALALLNFSPLLLMPIITVWFDGVGITVESISMTKFSLDIFKNGTLFMMSFIFELNISF